VLGLLEERFHEWQRQGYLPSRRIVSGYNTEQPVRERGWTYWNHLFNPRQLLLSGSLNERISQIKEPQDCQITCLLGLQRSVDHNSRLSGWSASIGKEIVDHVFANQALNTLNNFGARAAIAVKSAFLVNIQDFLVQNTSIIEPADGRTVNIAHGSLILGGTSKN